MIVAKNFQIMYHYYDKKKTTDPGRSENTKQDKYQNKLKNKHLGTSYSNCNKQTTPLKKNPTPNQTSIKNPPKHKQSKKIPNQPTKQTKYKGQGKILERSQRWGVETGKLCL